MRWAWCCWRCCCWFGRNLYSAWACRGHFHCVPRRGDHAVRSRAQVCRCTTTTFSRRWAQARRSSALWMPRTMCVRRSAPRAEGFKDSVRFEQVDFAYESDGETNAGAARDRPECEARRGDCDCGAKRGREIVAGEPDSALLRRDRRTHSDRRPRPARRDHRQPAQADRQSDPGDDPVQRYGAQQHRVRTARRAAGPSCRRRRTWRWRTILFCACRMDTTP